MFFALCIQFNKSSSGCPFPAKKKVAFEMDPEKQVEMEETLLAETEQHEKRKEESMDKKKKKQKSISADIMTNYTENIS